MIGHVADIILLEDTPSIQMEVGVLVKEFPDIRYEILSHRHTHTHRTGCFSARCSRNMARYSALSLRTFNTLSVSSLL